MARHEELRAAVLAHRQKVRKPTVPSDNPAIEHEKLRRLLSRNGPLLRDVHHFNDPRGSCIAELALAGEIRKDDKICRENRASLSAGEKCANARGERKSDHVRVEVEDVVHESVADTLLREHGGNRGVEVDRVNDVRSLPGDLQEGPKPQQQQTNGKVGAAVGCAHSDALDSVSVPHLRFHMFEGTVPEEDCYVV